MNQTDESYKARLAALINFHSTLFTRAESYTKLVMVAGFGGFFATWQLSKDSVSPLLGNVAAILMSLSVTCFVLFEVWKMIKTGRALVGIASEIAKYGEVPDADFIAAVAEAETRQQVTMARLNRYWLFALVPSVLSGVVAVGLLLFAFIRAIFRCPLLYRH